LKEERCKTGFQNKMQKIGSKGVVEKIVGKEIKGKAKGLKPGG